MDFCNHFWWGLWLLQGCEHWRFFMVITTDSSVRAARWQSSIGGWRSLSFFSCFHHRLPPSSIFFFLALQLLSSATASTVKPPVTRSYNCFSLDILLCCFYSFLFCWRGRIMWEVSLHSCTVRTSFFPKAGATATAALLGIIVVAAGGTTGDLKEASSTLCKYFKIFSRMKWPAGCCCCGSCCCPDVNSFNNFKYSFGSFS